MPHSYFIQTIHCDSIVHIHTRYETRKVVWHRYLEETDVSGKKIYSLNTQQYVLLVCLCMVSAVTIRFMSTFTNKNRMWMEIALDVKMLLIGYCIQCTRKVKENHKAHLFLLRVLCIDLQKFRTHHLHMYFIIHSLCYVFFFISSAQ